MSKVDYSVGEHLYMLPSDMNLKIKTDTVWYNNKILIFDGNFSLGKNEKVNAGLAKSEEETTTKQTTTIHKVVMKAPQLPAPAEKAISLMKMRKLLLFFFSLVALWYGTCFDD